MRIIAGAYKGHKLLSPPARSDVRPMTASVKKSLFDILGPRLEDANVLDLYCGTGPIGLEALSRGAARCCFAERDRVVITRLRRNIKAIGADDQCDVWPGDVTTHLGGWLSHSDAPVDLAFVDPPYAQVRRWEWPRVSRTIFAPIARRLIDDGMVVLRLPAKVQPPERIGPLAVRRLRSYGDMTLAILGAEEEKVE